MVINGIRGYRHFVCLIFTTPILSTMTYCEACRLIKTRNDFPRRRSPTKLRRCKACVSAKYFGSVCCADCGECKEMATGFHQNQRKVPKGTWKCKVCVATQWQRAHYGNVLQQQRRQKGAGSSIGASKKKSTVPPSISTGTRTPSWKPSRQQVTPVLASKEQDVLSELMNGFSKISVSPRSVEEELQAVCMPAYREKLFQEQAPNSSECVVPSSPRSISIEELRDKVHVSIDENGLVSVSLEKRY